MVDSNPPIYIIWRSKDAGTFHSRVIYRDGRLIYQYTNDSEGFKYDDWEWISSTRGIWVNMKEDMGYGYNTGMDIY